MAGYMSDTSSRLGFVREAERLKSVVRSGHTSTGRSESTAEHSWRLCLLAMVFEDRLGPLDLTKLLKMCVLHDLGEALHGDVPAVLQEQGDGKSDRERRDLLTLMGSLPVPLRDQFLSLWDEYEQAGSPEAKAAKALDKIETILQHNQGANPPDFDYAFNLQYGRAYTDAAPLFQEIRALIDADTASKAGLA